MKIFANIELNESQKNRMREIASPADIYFSDPESLSETDHKEFLGSDIGFGECPPNWLADGGNLRWMQFDSVGVGEYAHLDWDLLSKNLICTNLKGFFAASVAETALAGILALYRGIDTLVQLKNRRVWEKLDLRARIRTLAESEVLLVGYGALGKQMRKLLAPFGCIVTAYDKFADGAELKTTDELDIALANADIVCVALPETVETDGLFANKRLSLIKRGAIFVNVGRGSVVDEVMLAESLKSGRLGGAVLDVTKEEPLPADHPLWDCPNTIITQHTAGGSSDELDRKMAFFAENLKRYRSDLELENIVDWKRGF